MHIRDCPDVFGFCSSIGWTSSPHSCDQTSKLSVRLDETGIVKALLATGADMNLLEVNKPSILSFD